MKVAIRVDASPVIGTGHARRCLALAAGLREIGAEVRFVTRNLGLPIEDEVRAAGFAATVLPRPTTPNSPDPIIAHSAWAEVSTERDIAETAAALADWPVEWMVVDSYAFDATWHRGIRAVLKSRVAVVDDLADRALYAEMVIDPNFGAGQTGKYGAVLQRKARILAGSRFALLGPAYTAAKPQDRVAEVTSIGVFMGGFDQLGLSAVALRAVRDAGFEGAVEVVTSTNDPRFGEIQAAVAADPNAMLSTDLPDLAGFFARHGLQVGAGGGATWERCCLGAPSVLVMTAENQRAVIPALAAAGIVAACEPSQAAIAVEVRALLADPARRQSMADNARRLVDGQGARRTALALAASTLSVRPASMADAAIMHRWRNDPVTRAVSRQGEPIELAAHMEWLDRALGDPDRQVFVGMIGPVTIGVIRFDRADESSCEVSLYLDPDLHGLGLGEYLLAAGERTVGRGLCIVAEVLEDNPGSARLFEKSGYQRVAPGFFRKLR